MTTMAPYYDGFPEPQIDATEPNDLKERREAALERYQAEGLPTTKQESWRYTSLRTISGLKFQTSQVRKDFDPAWGKLALLSEKTSTRQIVLNGFPVGQAPKLAQGISLWRVSTAHDRFEVSSLLGSLLRKEDSSLSALNLAAFQDGLIIHVEKGTVADLPVELVFATDTKSGEKPIVTYPRVLVIVEKNSELVLIENYVSANSGCYFTNGISEVFLGENSQLTHHKIQDESLEATHYSEIKVTQDKDSRFCSNVFALGAQLARSEISSYLDGEGASCRLNGLFVGNKERHLDHYTVVDHSVPQTSSTELYKGILQEKSTGVFQGKVIVRKDAQKTDAKQMSRNLLLSTDAQINTKPQLEILANDVKCSHGATVGRMDEEALFYLRSRGISVGEARHMLTVAFASEMLEQVSNSELREALSHRVQAVLNAEGMGANVG